MMQTGEAMKKDVGKLKYELVSVRFMRGMVHVLTFGATKYASHNWRLGFAWSRPYAALQRHLNDWWDGEDTDPETGVSHLYHAACELMFLAELMETRPELDDRFKTKSMDQFKESLAALEALVAAAKSRVPPPPPKAKEEG